MPECRVVDEPHPEGYRAILDCASGMRVITVTTLPPARHRTHNLSIVRVWPGGLFSQPCHSESYRSHGDLKELHARMIEYAKSLLGVDNLWDLLEYG